MRAWGASSRSRSPKHASAGKASKISVTKADSSVDNSSSKDSSCDAEQKQTSSSSHSRSASPEKRKRNKSKHSDRSRKHRRTKRVASPSRSSPRDRKKLVSRRKCSHSSSSSSSRENRESGTSKRRVCYSEKDVGVDRRRPQKAEFAIIYWGGVGFRGWEFNKKSNMPRICQHCDDLVDSWRGRLENAQLTLRICAAEGGGFKDFVKHFVMLSSGDAVDILLPKFYRWCIKEKKKVLTERIVIGSILEVNDGRISPRDSGIEVVNSSYGRCAWEAVLSRLAAQMQQDARRSRGHFACVLLDGTGTVLRMDEMLKRSGRISITHLLVVLGGPDGIPEEQKMRLSHLLVNYTDLPLLTCSLPGGRMHSYYALATFFVMHDQDLLLPFLAHLAEGGTT